MKITKAIIPAAGFGTRFLPETKAVPKEMLPIIDTPAIQYIVEEAFRANLKHLIIVDSKHKRAIEDHFDAAPELESILASQNKTHLLQTLNKIMKHIDFTYVRQGEPLGLGHAIWRARHAIGKEYVAVLLPDDIITGNQPAIAQLMTIAQQEKCSVIAVQEMPLEDISSYGVITVKKQFSPNLFQIRDLVEKPSSSEAPTNLAIVGRYVLSPNIFNALGEMQQQEKNEEIQLTDAIKNLVINSEKVFAYKIQGTRFDTGAPFGWLKANIILSLTHPQYGNQMMRFLKELDKDLVVMQKKAEILEQKLR